MNPDAPMGTINGDAVDRFTLVHMGMGYLVGRLGVDWRSAIAGAVAFEAIEDGLKNTFPEAFPHPTHDTKINAIADIGAFLAGYVLATTKL